MKVIIDQSSSPMDSRSHRSSVVYRRLLMLFTFYVVPVTLAFKPINDPDVWWHLRTGEWIVTHRTVPWTDPFSLTGGPWVAYSWLFEVLLYGIYAAFGLFGIVLLPAAMSVAIILAFHLLIRRAGPPFWVEFTLLGIAIMILVSLLAQPRSWLFTFLFALVELHVLAAYRSGARARCLLVLPPLLALWANIHIQFVYGLGLLGLALVDAVIKRYVSHDAQAGTHVLPLVMTGIAASFAFLLNPYGVHLAQPVVDAVRLGDPFIYISELNALTFRGAGDWMVLALSLATVFTLGWRKTIEPLPALVFLFGCVVGFRARRDVWLLTIAGSWLLSSFIGRRDPAAFVLTPRRATALVALAMSVSLGLASYKTSNAKLERSLHLTFPVAAAAAVELRGYPGPLFNNYDWGGYLMWRLPHLKVALDGRNTLHGDAKVWRSIRTWAGLEGWDSDPDLAASRLVIAPRSSGLTSLLRLDRRFSAAYEDELAVVFVKDQEGPEIAPGRKAPHG